MKDSPVKINYTYDGRNRLTSVRYENGIVMTYRYDPVGNLTACKVSSQHEAAVIDSSPSRSPQPVQTGATTSTCSRCGTPLIPGKKFCRSCGAAVTAPAAPSPAVALLVCPACGSQNRPGATFCAKCGRKFT